MKNLLCLLALTLVSVQFASAADPYVPPELRNWERWVLHGQDHRQCPRFFNRATDSDAFVCAWAEPLQLAVNARGGRFDLRVQAFAETWLALPGDGDNFPQEVSINERPVVVLEKDGQPGLQVAAGMHRISGRFSWTRRPETLRLPIFLALLDLNVDGKVIDNPERRGERLWLGEPRQQGEQPASLDIKVYRLLQDGIPMLLQSRIELVVGGAAREVVLGQALPDAFAPMALESGLPARIDPDGRLRVQLRPGNHVVSISARASEIMTHFNGTQGQENWTGTEIWSYADNPRLRVSHAVGDNPADPSQLEVPPQWRQYPSFVLLADQALRIEERGRGASAQRDNAIHLSRTLWLDFDGMGFTARDRLGGEMRTGWRLDMVEPFTLKSATSDGEKLLVTAGATAGLSGIELRSPKLAVEASSRTGRSVSLPVSGWSETMSSVNATLNLPPGYMLLAALGVDDSPGAWTQRWQLLDFFLLLVIAVAVRRLFGNLAGILALFALLFRFHEPGAPVWAWLNLVVAIALARAVTGGLFARLAQAYRALSVVALLVMLVPFVANQARIALFPQLDRTGEYQQAAALQEVYAPIRAPSDAARVLESVTSEAGERSRQELAKRAELPAAGSTFYERYDPDAQVQTGPGLPGWRWRAVALRWNGPVEPQQHMRLIMTGRWLTALWQITGAALSVLLFYLLVSRSLDLQRFARRLGRGTAVWLVGLLGVSGLGPGEAIAETPPQAMLEELKSRLTAAPDCVPQCASLPSARVDISPRELAMELEVHAGDEVAIPLPGNDESWQASEFSVDGRRRVLLFRDADGTLWLNLAPGIHKVRLAGPMPGRDSFQVQFPMPPGEVLAVASGWEITGIRDQRLVSGVLELIRIQTQGVDSDADKALAADRFPTFVRVDRALQLGLDWGVNTAVRRVAPQTGAINLQVPLLAGESVISAGVPVSDSRATVNLAPGESGFAWQSSLQPANELVLSAGEGPWREVWRIEASHMWHPAYDGTPLILPVGFPGRFWVPEFHPRPGETLRIAVTRPAAVPGATLAIDKVDYVQTVGDRNSDLTLGLEFRSTRGQQQRIRLPAGAELGDVLIDGRKAQLRLDDDHLTLPVTPGSHQASISFRLQQGAQWRQQLPTVDLSAPASNLNLGIKLPRDRWVLATRGPTLGPAVLYWAELVVFILAALLLGRTTLTPLRTHDWLLLGLGFSTFSWGVLLLVAAWLFVMGWRARNPEFGQPVWFNLRQLVLALFSVGVVLTLVSAIPMALLGNPDMHVAGNGSWMHELRWFADRNVGELPMAAAYSAPLWIYKLLILLWSLWLSFALVRWLPWAWQALRAGGTWAEPAADTAPGAASLAPGKE